ncbi:hypothetical protein [Nocardia sp. NPDC020380]|uniref:hypothetical protein n=1 Tax=Nocardia sp. NPDC020380 TaxID=3364309 RepID=UPI0037AF06CC
MTAPLRRGNSGRVRESGYGGPQFHCTRWRGALELRGLHVAVVGSGAAVARVLPPVAARARKVTVFQHDPVWVLPTPPLPGVRPLLRLLPKDLVGPLPAATAPPLLDALTTEAAPHPAGSAARIGASANRRAVPASHRTAPAGRSTGATEPASSSAGTTDRRIDTAWLGIGTGFAAALAGRVGGHVLRRVAAANLRVQVGDSWRRRQLTPDTAAGLRLHSHYYRALRQPNCRLVTWPIARLAPLGIRTVDGIEHRVDCIIYAEDTP